MRFSRHFPLCCAAVLALSWPCRAADDAGVLHTGPAAVASPRSLAGRMSPMLLAQAQPAPDSAAVERAREQLRQKVSELEAQQGGTNPPAAVAAAPGAGSTPLSQTQQDELRKALDAAMQQAPPAGSPALTPADATRKAKADLKARTKAEARKKPAPPQSSPKTVPAQPAVAAAAPPAAAAPQPPPSAPAFSPIQGPPLPVSAGQQRRLADLLVRYIADQVTPEEYQRERAKILSEK